MSKRSNLLYLGDMFDHARRANERVAAVSRDEFMRDEDLQIDVMHHVRIVGEAASRLSSDIRDAHPEIPWVDIIGMRHVIVHDYFKIK